MTKRKTSTSNYRDVETLKTWRRNNKKVVTDDVKLLDNYQVYPCKDFETTTPYDVDPEFFKMLNRSDLYKTLTEIEESRRETKKTEEQPKMSVW
jgi:hypothetical protein